MEMCLAPGMLIMKRMKRILQKLKYTSEVQLQLKSTENQR